MVAPTRKWNSIYFGLGFAWRVWRQTRTADEVWVHCSWTFPVWFGALAGKIGRKGRKLVVVPEGSFDPKRLGNHAAWKKRLVAPLDRWVLRRADEVLALCPDEIGWVRGFEPKAKVVAGQVPVFCKQVSEGGRGMAKGVPLKVLFLGRAEDPLKGVRFLERAVRELEAGRGTGDGVRRRVELRVESAVFGKEKEAAWEWCDVFCLPTVSDNFGLVVAEALEHGKPVITTDGASAWAGLRPPIGIYLKGYRDGTDESRVKLLKEALTVWCGT